MSCPFLGRYISVERREVVSGGCTQDGNVIKAKIPRPETAGNVGLLDERVSSTTITTTTIMNIILSTYTYNTYISVYALYVCTHVYMCKFK